MDKKPVPTEYELRAKAQKLSETARAELRKRGMTDAEIDAAMQKKRKGRKRNA